MIQLQSGSQAYDVCRFNWFHDSDNKGIRCDGEPGGELATHMYNVGWNLRQGIQAKGREHSIVNNTFFQCGKRCDITVLGSEEFGGNDGTRTYNNAGERISGHRVRPVSSHPLPGEHGNNWIGLLENKSIQAVIRDPKNFDFRPVSNSVLIDSGEAGLSGVEMFYSGSKPDIGAYDSQDSNYWIPGYQQSKPSMAVPPHKSYSVLPDADLMWLGAYHPNQETKHFLVYFGAMDEGLGLVSTQKNNVYDPGLLEPDKVYQWRIDEVLQDGTTIQGETWRFVAGGVSAAGILLPSTYEESFDFSADDAEMDPWAEVLWTRDSLQDSLSAILVNDHLELDLTQLVGGEPTDFIVVEDVNSQVRNAPLLELQYRTSKHIPDSFYVFIRVRSDEGKQGEWTKLSLAPNQDKSYQTQILNVSSVFSAWDSLHGEENWTNLEAFDICFAQDSANYNQNAMVTIDHFTLGFAVAADHADKLVVLGQGVKTAPNGGTAFLSPMDFELGLITTLSTDTIPIWNLADFSGTPRIEVRDTNGFTEIDENLLLLDTLKEDSIWTVPVTMFIGELSAEEYLYDINRIALDDSASSNKQAIGQRFSGWEIQFINQTLLIEAKGKEPYFLQAFNLKGELIEMSGILRGSSSLNVSHIEEPVFLVLRNLAGSVMATKHFNPRK